MQLTSDAGRKKKLFRTLLVLYAISYLFSNGPGLMLVNKPTLVAGIPILYLWALAWAIVQIALIMIAYNKIWRKEIEEEVHSENKTAGEVK